MGMSRRDFMRFAGAAGLASVTGRAVARTTPTNHGGNDGMGMLTDLTLCLGCRKCEWACKEANGLPNQQPLDAYEDKSVFEQRRRTDGENVTVVNRYPAKEPGGQPVHVKSQCMHCVDPSCQAACLVSAFRKTPEGPVLYDESICIGCRYCMVACPFNIPAYTYDDPFTPVVRKCTMCFERFTKTGEKPACAAVCPVETITFGKRSELIALAREKIAKHPDKYIDHIYGEHEAGGTNWLYIADRPFEELGFQANVGTTPIPELTAGLDGAVPLILTVWPAVLAGAYAFSKRREELARAEVARVTKSGPASEVNEHE
jgi:Fe-S-cluster-containing dehydrogenase component